MSFNLVQTFYVVVPTQMTGVAIELQWKNRDTSSTSTIREKPRSAEICSQR